MNIEVELLHISLLTEFTKYLDTSFGLDFEIDENGEFFSTFIFEMELDDYDQLVIDLDKFRLNDINGWVTIDGVLLNIEDILLVTYDHIVTDYANIPINITQRKHEMIWHKMLDHQNDKFIKVNDYLINNLRVKCVVVERYSSVIHFDNMKYSVPQYVAEYVIDKIKSREHKKTM